MGIANKITREKYYMIKKMLKVPADDAKVIEMGLCGASSCRNIRNTKNYKEYCERVYKCKHPKTVKKVYVHNKKHLELRHDDFFDYKPSMAEEWEDARRSMNMLAMIFCVILAVLITGIAIAGVAWLNYIGVFK